VHLLTTPRSTRPIPHHIRDALQSAESARWRSAFGGGVPRFGRVHLRRRALAIGVALASLDWPNSSPSSDAGLTT